MNKATKPTEHEMEHATAKEQLRVVIVGHVDHGKSTLVGRLFHDTGMLPEGKFEAIEEMCRRRGMPFEWSFLLDALIQRELLLDVQIPLRHVGLGLVVIIV
ncbi:MAG TPA: hypothetical protein EYQ80_02260 [Candidatus Poseidoniales archaeon]|nr:hypothetical protein [Candidatus Poseidoniales archaeon]